MKFAILEYEWTDWEGNLCGHYSDGTDHIIRHQGEGISTTLIEAKHMEADR